MAVISIIVPCYNEEASLPFFLPEIKKVADHMSAAYSVNLDILFINDDFPTFGFPIIATVGFDIFLFLYNFVLSVV